MAATGFLIRAEESELARRWLDLGDEAARNRLVASHQPLVLGISRRYFKFPLPQEDLTQQGMLGLMRACDTFQVDRGLRFATYARWWAQAAIAEYVLQNASVVAHNRSNLSRRAFFKGKGHLKIVSLDAPVGDGGETFIDVLESPSDSPEDTALRVIDSERATAKIRDAVGRLDARSRRVIQERWLSDEKATLESLGAALGVSKERIRQIESRAMEFIKAAVEGREFKAPRRKRTGRPKTKRQAVLA
ncbi:RNA polymerase sigma factor RpoH [Mesorhizobium sp. L-8-10]|uniref:sigma-70 family RNA polymerase sigma factor n=1 Tax=Mesorhizobium sp. L-8-10 TaxID=2744523 RepID=UPI0019272361|nr:sigma-70 family RNA polymerase sigma factor [Mesorhizobium sp. L-8-10]BCH33232.1 RNA polymerase sigma factor RpoH [Mesorhizobium sp. L-8-10]